MAVILHISSGAGYFSDKEEPSYGGVYYIWTRCQSKAYKFTSEEEGTRLLKEWYTPDHNWLSIARYPNMKWIPVED